MCDKSFRYKVSQRTHKCPAQTSDNIQQLSDTNAQEVDDKTIGQQTTDKLKDNQSLINIVNNEENKFVLIINAQGQHVLALQAEINNITTDRKEQKVEFRDANNVSKDATSDTNNPNSKLEESAESMENVQSNNEKVNIKNTNDFFSMVMSPLENSISSPTFEMEHLRVSSPKQKENSIDSYPNFPEVSDNVQINMVEPDMEQSFSCKDVADSLQTINEESLKELLYGMDRK